MKNGFFYFSPKIDFGDSIFSLFSKSSRLRHIVRAHRSPSGSFDESASRWSCVRRAVSSRPLENGEAGAGKGSDMQTEGGSRTLELACQGMNRKYDGVAQHDVFIRKQKTVVLPSSQILAELRQKLHVNQLLRLSHFKKFLCPEKMSRTPARKRRTRTFEKYSMRKTLSWRALMLLWSRCLAVISMLRSVSSSPLGNADSQVTLEKAFFDWRELGWEAARSPSMEPNWRNIASDIDRWPILRVRQIHLTGGPGIGAFSARFSMQKMERSDECER